MGIQRLNKKGIQFQKAFYGIIVFSVLIIAFGVIFSNTSPAYNVANPSDLGDLDRLDSISGDINTQKGKLSANDPDPGQDAESNTFRGVYGIIANIFSPFKLVFGQDGIIDNVVYRLGLPDYVRQMFVAFIIVAFTFAIIGIIFRLGRTP